MPAENPPEMRDAVTEAYKRDVDLLGQIVGGGTYEELLPHTFEVEIFGLRCRCLDLETLIRVKRAAGRPKDLEAIGELEVILEELRDSRSGGALEPT